jgi:hypothetical protein
VKNLQAFLVSKKYLDGDVTGYFGPKTREAVKRYQKEKGLEVVGKIGPATRKHLNDDEGSGSEGVREGRGERGDDDRDEHRGGRATSTPVVIPVTSTSTTPTTGTTTVKSVSSTVNFSTPGGVNSLTLKVSGNAGVIADFTYSVQTNDGTSKSYANSFTTSLNKSSLVGKTISNVSLSRVGGASLTTNAFMNALKGVQGSI